MEGMIENFVRKLERMRSYKDQISHLETIPSQKAAFGEVETPLPTCIQDFLSRKNIQLFCHQADAINEIRKGNNIVIATPTASGKTLSFNIPVFEAIHNNRKATALFLYPTKALTNDQLKVLREMEHETGIEARSNVYDGDTPKHQRPSIRQNSNVILSNPYGLHQYPPWHYKWKTFFQNINFLIIDEAHVYRGVFGSNVAMLIRRLLRICNHYGSDPKIIISSATIANPEEHATKLTGKKFKIISKDCAPRGKKLFIFWNPPFIDDTKTIRRSTHQETKDLFLINVSERLQTLCFTSSRQMAELITRWTRDELRKKSQKLASSVTAYRAGYLPQERRDIENRLKTRNLIGVTSTNALELGIDIGTLDSVIISGYPGTVISTWQQAGRSGRGVSDSLVTLVAFQNPLDQYFMKNPQDFFGRPNERAIIDLHNPYISAGHLMCAASELPIKDQDQKYFGRFFSESFNALEQQSLVRKTPNGWVYSGTARPVEIVNLDSISDKTVRVLHNGELLETLSLTKAYEETHEGAVLLHQGETYIVEEFDLNSLIAKVRREDVNYYTESRKTVDVAIKKTFEEKTDGVNIGLGEVSVTEHYHDYVIKTYDEVIGREPLDLPPLTFPTIGMWFTVPNEIEKEIQELGLDFQGGIHAVEHAMIAMAPFYAMCDRRDIGGLSTSIHPDTGCPTIFIYDGFEGGIGISENLYSVVKELWDKTLSLINNCECKDGCPSCIYSPKCGNENEPLDKQAAIIILRKLLADSKKDAFKKD
jgi:DEAD/DEAH box helicase domain-containing protein